MQKRVLIVEDEVLVAMALEDEVRAIGLDVMGPVNSAIAAKRLIADDVPDYALLDYRLTDGAAEALVRTLRRCGVPFAWITGCTRWELPAGPEPVLQKPWDPAVLEDLFARGLVPTHQEPVQS